MEVNVALLVLAVGLIGLFSLFPVGLRQSDLATSDTAQAAFAETVFNAMRANAGLVTNWNEWSGLTNGVQLGVSPASPAERQITVPTAMGGTHNVWLTDRDTRNPTGEVVPVGNLQTDGYYAKGKYIKYKLHIKDDPNDPHDPSDGCIKRVWIQVTDRPYTDVARSPVYGTSFVYMGM
jgi:type II secretory pathway component PulJ